MEIENLKTSLLVPYARNSRTHSEEQVAQIMSSIKEFGFTNPILIDNDGMIIAGHGRLVAAQRLDMNSVPCIRLKHLTEAQKRAYVIADNKIALNAGWDEDMLRVELGELDALEFDYSDFGFDFELDNVDDNQDQDYSEKNKEIDVSEYEDVMDLKFKLSFSEYAEAKEKLSEIAGTPEVALKILLKMEL